MNVKSAFDTAAGAYDTFAPPTRAVFRRLLPLRSWRMIPLRRDEQIEALVLGPARGCRELVLREFPSARVTLLDLSKDDACRGPAALEPCGERAEFRNCDYARERLPCISTSCAGSVHHHLEASGRNISTAGVFQSLRPGGFFVNADQWGGVSPAVRDLPPLWIERAKRTRGPEDVQEQAHERTKLDRLSPLDGPASVAARSWLRGVDCYYKWYHFAVFGGRRPADKEQ